MLTRILYTPMQFLIYKNNVKIYKFSLKKIFIYVTRFFIKR